jgi:hypothetical protein
MHGDFSRWFPRIPKNQVGILAQEGRILLDADVNAQNLLGVRWQDLAARAAFGAGIAAIPADAPDGWKVTGAQLAGKQVSVSVMPGIAWADGLLVELDGPPGKPVTLTATSLQPPHDPGTPGTRDAVVLEVWRRALNGFQVPGELIEPALGGPDTAERIETAFALRLYKLADGDDCRSIIGALRDNLATRGKLHATLAPPTTIPGDCPVVDGGGYSGFEHDLYRIEIADVDSGAPSFKWSQWNGGLVGRGQYDATTKKLTITGNDQAIRYAGLDAFYLEVLYLDTSLGGWRIAYGARASLDADGLIDLSGPASFGQLPGTPTLCFRIWNDLRTIAEFPMGAANELRDGIRLELEPQGVYVPGDYWTFQVRAGGLANPQVLLDHAPPIGVHHHRVPLAELHWTQAQTATVEDCRVPLHPVTANEGCCTHSVGDNITSHGDFTKINDAIAALPATGGRVCVLPGEYRENVLVQGKTNVEIVGCGPRSKIVATDPEGETFTGADPAIHVLDSSAVTIADLQVSAGRGGIAILLEADDQAGTTNVDGGGMPLLENLRVTDCLVNAGAGSGIEIRGGYNAELRGNRILVTDQVNEWAAITVDVQGARIERNYVQVIDTQGPENQALGGIWLRGGCTDVDVVDNEIIGGIGHGVMLGHAEVSAGTGPIYALHINKAIRPGFIFNKFLPEGCVGCGPGTVGVPPPAPSGPTYVAGNGLQLIRIRNNSISAMGLSGIGVFGFFPSEDQGVISIEGLEITGNQLFENVYRQVADLGTDLADMGGYGAISLADVNGLVIRDNEITRNGTQASGAVCAIFVLAAEAVEITRNRIRGNGPTSPQHVTATAPHGGIWINYVTPPSSELLFDPPPLGRIAAAIRENEVHAPNGPALSMGALGHVQIVANAFTAEVAQQTTAYNNVIVLNFGKALGLKAAVPAVNGLKTGAITGVKMAAQLVVANKVEKPRLLTETEIGAAKIKINHGELLPAASWTPPPSSILFANNHCVTYAPDLSTLVGAVSLQGISDVQLTGNYFEVDTGWVFLPVYVTGGTIRAEGNRFVEAHAFYSLQAFGTYAIATGNIANHCLLVNGTSGKIDAQNIEIDTTLCPSLGNFPGLTGIKVGGSS